RTGSGKIRRGSDCWSSGTGARDSGRCARSGRRFCSSQIRTRRDGSGRFAFADSEERRCHSAQGIQGGQTPTVAEHTACVVLQHGSLMLYHILYEFLYPLNPYWSPLRALNLFRYITVRTAFSSLTALVLSLAMGPWLIVRLRNFQIGQHIRDEGPQSHKAK